jgi:putative hemolysin
VSGSEVMTPRIDMVAVPASTSIEEAKVVMLEAGHLRLPVYEDGLDRIVGILLARDLWQADSEGASDIRGIIRPAQFAPASKPVDDLIPEMRRQRIKMAIVIDEFGGTAGLVTLEDLIEEIIGEIQDEHEENEPVDFQEVGGGIVRVWGAVAPREVNERLGLDLPEDQYDTIGGFVFGRLNRIGEVGDEVEVDGGTFRITRMKGRRIEYVRFSPEAPAPE